MKSVIAQGASVAKAIEEALKKADMPTEFFVKILEDAQSGFLGFGAKKAKIALFFRQPAPHRKGDNILSQESYENLFDSDAIRKQIEHQLKDVGLPTASSKQPIQQQKPNVVKPQVQTPRAQDSRSQEFRNQTPRAQQPKTQESRTQESRTQAQASPMQRRELPTTPKNIEVRPLPVIKQEIQKPQDGQQTSTVSGDESVPQRSNRNHRRRRRPGHRPSGEPASPTSSVTKLTVRPLPPKNNDSSKS